MTDTVVKATLLLVDKSTKNINKVNAALKELLKTSKALEKQNKKTVFGFDAKGITQAKAQINSLKREINLLKATSRTPIRITADTRSAATSIRNLRQQASRTITARVTATGGVGGISGLGDGRRFGHDIGLGFRAAVGYELLQFAKRAVVQGATETDVSDTRLALQQLSAADDTAARRAVQMIMGRQRQTPSGQVLNEAQTQSLLAESLAVTRGDVNAAKLLTEELTSMIKLGLAQNQSLDAAIEGAISFAKAGEQAGKFTDAVTGAFDPKGVSDWFVLQRQTMVGIGKEYTGAFAKMLQQGLRSSKYPLTPEAWVKAALLQEENTSTGVGINQLIKNLTGGTDVKTQLNQADFGLIDLKEVRTGKVGGKGKTKLMWGGTTEEDLLRENPAQWVNDYVIPAMKAKGYDPASATAATKFASLIASDRTARETLTAMIIRNQELTAQAQQVLSRSGTTETIEQILKNASRLRFAGFGAQVENVAGNLVRAIEPILIPAMDNLNKSIADMAQGKVTPAHLATAGAGAAALSASSGIISQLTGISALTSTDDTTKVLGAIAVNTANTATGVAALVAADIFGGDVGKLGKMGGLLKRQFPLLGAFLELDQELGAVKPLTPEQEAAKQQRQKEIESTRDMQRIIVDMQRSMDPATNRIELNDKFENWARQRRGPSSTVPDMLRGMEEIRLNKAYLDLMRQGQTEGMPKMGEWLQMSTEMRSAFLDGSTSLTDAITTGGTNVASAMSGAAPGWGSAMAGALSAMMPSMGAVLGSNAAAQINAATVNVRYAAAPDTGAQTPIQ